VVNGAAAGDTVLLATGSYGTWGGTTKAGMVTIKPASGTTPTFAINLSGAKNLTFDGFTKFGGWQIAGSTNITVSNTTFTQPMQVTGTNTGIVFDRDVFDGLGHGTWEGRLSFGLSASGATVSNSHFGNGGCSDGIQVTGDSRDIKIVGNEFSGIKQGSCTTHSDPIQFYGASNVEIRGNYFHNNSTGIMSPDGNGSPMTLTDNVFVTDGEYPDQVVIGGGSGDVINHNTFANGARIRVGKVNVGFSARETITNNVITGGIRYSESQTASGFTVDHDVLSTPTYVGGATPASMAGYALAAGSLGKSGAADGSDLGARFDAPIPPPDPIPVPAPAASPTCADVPECVDLKTANAQLTARVTQLTSDLATALGKIKAALADLQ
jgi:hypothetical protein